MVMTVIALAMMAVILFLVAYATVDWLKAGVFGWVAFCVLLDWTLEAAAELVSVVCELLDN